MLVVIIDNAKIEVKRTKEGNEPDAAAVSHYMI
jgi:hypothetical protein